MLNVRSEGLVCECPALVSGMNDPAGEEEPFAMHRTWHTLCVWQWWLSTQLPGQWVVIADVQRMWSPKFMVKFRKTHQQGVLESCLWGEGGSGKQGLLKVCVGVTPCTLVIMAFFSPACASSWVESSSSTWEWQVCSPRAAHGRSRSHCFRFKFGLDALRIFSNLCFY